MTLTRITLSGCDDSTKVDIELTDDERALVQRIGQLTKERSEYDCQPTMHVEDTPELCDACKPGGKCTDPYAEDAGDCSTASSECRQRQEGTTTP
ncbi:MAG: hypothetical protein ACRDSF_00430 [Pseudonocardiaceae bacterium]